MGDVPPGIAPSLVPQSVALRLSRAAGFSGRLLRSATQRIRTAFRHSTDPIHDYTRIPGIALICAPLENRRVLPQTQVGRCPQAVFIIGLFCCQSVPCRSGERLPRFFVKNLSDNAVGISDDIRAMLWTHRIVLVEHDENSADGRGSPTQKADLFFG